MSELKCGYITNKEWPQDIYIQGEYGGMVIDDDTGDKIYVTAFIEAFPKEPSTYIRGEGNTLKEAELNAWNKYQLIINCSNHEFLRLDSGNHGQCTKCNLYQTDIFKSLKTCICCEKKEVYMFLNSKNEYYCLKDFMDLMSKKEISYMFDNHTIEKINNSDLKFETFEYQKYLELSVLIDAGIITYTEEEINYKFKTIRQDFIQFRKNAFTNVISKIKNCSWCRLSYQSLGDSLIFNKELFKELYISFINKNKYNEDEVLVHVETFITLFDSYYTKKYGDKFERLIRRDI